MHPTFHVPSLPTAPTSSSDYPPRRWTARSRPPVLVRPAETRQHSPFYLPPSPWLPWRLLVPFPHQYPLLPWLARPVETRQPPYLPSLLPTPPSCSPTPLELSRCCPPGGAPHRGPQDQSLTTAPGHQRARCRGPARVRGLFPPGAGHSRPLRLRLLARGVNITSLDPHVVGARRLILVLALALVTRSVPAPPC
jgi:hypothetical protein